ncbi:hypothetical protein ACFPES_13680 [Paenibacillus sp. GCM10023248]|uniref:hypothetical protein n=1 Tax=unclassified Paenibacillus TaxID=185978 RepID=UPI00237908B5|nr:hypothetical protein [Paenibacillus sp. MAHUQ-63]MDD9268084.1 hypothetical protein [Paenibacillus sp. MAHUQ-63]
MNTENQRLFKKPIFTAVTGWAVLACSTAFIYGIRLLMPSFTLLLVASVFMLVIFLLIWTTVSLFGLLQCLVDFKHFRRIKSKLALAEQGIRILLCAAGALLNILLVICNSIIIYRIYRLWQQFFL